MHFLTKIFDQEQQNFLLWIPALFAFGVSFYFTFSAVFSALFCVALFLFIIYRSFILLACIIFLCGGFYAKFYETENPVNGKIFVDVTGKVKSVKKFFNPVSGVEGMNLVVSDVSLKKAEVTTKKKVEVKKRKKRKKKISHKKIEKDFVNLTDYQEIDRKFLDYKSDYQNEIPSHLKNISVNLMRGSVSVNDEITFRALLQPPQRRDFTSDFDYLTNSQINKIAAYGFVVGEARILQAEKIANLDHWFLSLREKIRQQISSVLSGDEAAVALAFLIGDQTQISKDLTKQIRNSGLSHLLSISGFHLSLAGAIFFFTTRFALSRSEYLTLHFDLKKISAIVTIFAVYSYLKLAASPIPAQRAFIFVFFALLALFFSEKLDAKRATMFGALLLILANPYVVFSVSFQLSFVAILVLVSSSKTGRSYFWQIILLSILIQIATLPFLMHHFRNLALLGFASNLLAIPLTSFLVMPLGFFALFLMPLGLAKPALLLMNFGIILLEKIANVVVSLPYAHLTSPWLPSIGIVLATFGFLLICLTKTQLRFVGTVIFLASFLTIFLVKKPNVIFEQNQKFFAVYDENGLSFSKKLRPSKQRHFWMNHFDENEFKTFPCENNFCAVVVKNKKILVLLQRNKISEICNKANGDEFDVIVNLTKKYELPDCIAKNKIKIDNKDFYLRGTQFLFFENEEFGSNKIYRSSKKERDDKGDFRNDSERIDGDMQDDSTNDERSEIES